MNPQTWLTAIAVTAGVAVGGHWDDESFLGRGPTGVVGATVAITRQVSVEAETGYAVYERNAGALESHGHSTHIATRLSVALGPDRWAVRPFVSGGALWDTASGHFITADVEGRPTRRNWHAPMSRSWEAGAGLEIRATSRLTIRPEARWSISADNTVHSTIEAPVLALRAGVTAVWRLTK